MFRITKSKKQLAGTVFLERIDFVHLFSTLTLQAQGSEKKSTWSYSNFSMHGERYSMFTCIHAYRHQKTSPGINLQARSAF